MLPNIGIKIQIFNVSAVNVYNNYTKKYFDSKVLKVTIFSLVHARTDNFHK